MPKLSNDKIIDRLTESRRKNNLQWEKIFNLAGAPIAKSLHRRRIKANIQLMSILRKAMKHPCSIPIIKKIVKNDRYQSSLLDRLS